jgi:N-acetylglucosamine kinase-like BadF-type ATPase
LLGDDGSGYAIGRAALRHALEQLESNHGISRLAERVLQQLEAKSVADVTSVIYQSSDPRAGIAALAPLVVKLAAETDETASAILDAAARDLAALVARAARAADLADQPFTAAASGGVIVSSLQLQERIRAKLARLEIPCELQIVEQPLVGCVRLAAREFAGLDVVWR